MRLTKKRAQALCSIISCVQGVWSNYGDDWECIEGLSKDEKKTTNDALEWAYEQGFKRLNSAANKVDSADPKESGG